MFLSQIAAAFQFPDSAEEWIFEVIGIVASVFVFFSFFWSNEKKTRLINMVGCVVFVVYAILIGSLSVMIMNDACIVLHVVKLVQMHQRKQKEKKSADDTSAEGVTEMECLYLENSPIAYYIDRAENKEWLVFVHAAFVDHRMFEKQFEYFSGKYNLLAIDILGHGNSIRARKGDKIENMSDWIARILKKHDIPAAHFVGVSLGSVFIQDFANKYEDKVLSLACFGGYDVNNFDAKRQKTNSKAQMKMTLKALISVKWFAKANKKISAYTSEAQTEFYNLNVQFRKKSFTYLAGLNKLVNKYPKGQRQYGLLLGCGEHDLPMEIEIVNEWAEYENCDKVILKGAGHCANMDAPQSFNACLESFLQKSKR